MARIQRMGHDVAMEKSVGRDVLEGAGDLVSRL